MSVVRYITDHFSRKRRSASESEDVSTLSPWTLACAVGTLNGSLRGHPELGGIAFARWVTQPELRPHEASLREYAFQNIAKSYHQVLREERARRGRDTFPSSPVEGIKKSVVFLDFDGVLVTRHLCNRQQADPNCVAVLNSILEATRSHIVLSSDWRLDYSLDSLLYVLRDWQIDSNLVLGVTPRLPDTNARGIEIQAWLDERDERYGDVRSFVILDDHDDMAHLRPFLVRSTLDVGLTKELGEEAVKVLRGCNSSPGIS
jgi:hypothetical protein